MSPNFKLLTRWTVIVLCAMTVFSIPASAAFLESLWGARPAALAGAYTAISDDANAPAYNPAGISLITQNEITFMYARLFAGVNLYSGEDTSRLGLGYFSYVPTIKNKAYGSYAFSWSSLAATNLYREDSFTLTVADSYQFDSLGSAPILSYGANLKLLRRAFSTDQRTDQDPVFQSGRDSQALTVDAGVIFRPHWQVLPGLKMGLSGQNLTEPNIGLADSDRVPMRISVGLAYQDRALPLINPSVEFSRRDGRTLITGAWEAWLAPETLALRVGANADQAGGGIGYQFRLMNKLAMRFDYAILWPLNIDGSSGSHRVSISSAF
ncbi:MAG: hypothetical protein KCHDKBKB_01407 [Elusimicrobia bacterium]|nr:hypothetical protein [Elusimicrobiota bacterium]